MSLSHRPSDAPLARGFPIVLVVLLVLNILPELILQMCDYGIIGLDYLRPLAYYLGAFQPDLLNGRGPVYPGHSLMMFITYGFLHTGFLHLAVNMIGLVWLGRIILSYRTSETFLVVYLMSMIGAAELFVLIAPVGGTLAGASGALFGLLGVYAVDHRILIPSKSKNRPVVQVPWLVVATITFALGDWISQRLMGTPVAWQAHSGGFITGAIIAMISPPRHAGAP